MTRMTALSVCALAALCAAVFTGCATPTRTPVYQNSRFNPAEVDRITVLPVLDLRMDKTVNLNLNKAMQGNAKSCLKQRKYAVDLSSGEDVVSRLTEEDLQAKDTEWLKTLQASDSRWVFIFAVHDVTRKLTFGSTGNAEVSAYFFDRQSGEQLWHDKGVGQAGQGGLLGMAMIGMMSQEALNMASYRCLMSFPRKR